MSHVEQYYDFEESDFPEEENNLYNAVCSGNWEKIVNALFTNDLESSSVSIYHDYCLNKIGKVYIPEIPYSYLWNVGKTEECDVDDCECSSITPLVKLFTTCDIGLLKDVIDFKLLTAEDISDADIVDLFFYHSYEDRFIFTQLLLDFVPLERLIDLGIFLKVYMHKNVPYIYFNEKNYPLSHRMELQKLVKAKIYVAGQLVKV